MIMISPETLLADLDPEQSQAVQMTDGPLLVIAGPGSGKTRVLTYRLAYLINLGVESHKLLALTFTNKAAAEMKQRLNNLVGENHRATVSTFHSACVRILRRWHEQVGLPSNFTILDSADQLRALTRAANLYTPNLLTGNTTEDREYLADALKKISQAKNYGMSSAMLRTADNTSELGLLMAAYERFLTDTGCVDFDDLLVKVDDLLTNSPDAADALRARWDYAHVDEFQDTNSVQYRIIKALSLNHQNLCVVGDADQSIYAFRGAKPSVVNEFLQDFPHAQTIVLNSNYRSHRPITEVSKAIIAPNVALNRSVQTPTHTQGEKVVLTRFGSDLSEAAAIVANIKDKGAPFSEQAILVRTNTLTRTLEAALREAHIPYLLVGTTQFYDRAEIKDALAYLRLAINSADQFAFARASAVPKRGIGPAALGKIFEEAPKQESLVTHAQNLTRQSTTKQGRVTFGFCNQLESMGNIARDQGPSAALKFVYDSMGLREHYRGVDQKDRTDKEANLDELLTDAAVFERQNENVSPTQLTALFLERVSLLESTDVDDEADAVHIMTIHAAKGKEFNHVYIPGLEEDILPHVRAMKEGANALAEERRLFFVAASRARHTLRLSYCGTRMRFGSVSEPKPSRFIADLPTQWVTTEIAFSSPRGSFTSRDKFTPGTTKSSALPKRTHVVSTLKSEDLREKMKVKHAMFGEGEVREVNPTSVRIYFPDIEAVKHLSLAVAPLEIV